MCTPKTWSEKLFENWCRDNGVNFRCIPREKDRRTPDYELVINGTAVIAEVKHIDDNFKDKSDRQRIRKKIKKCQLSNWIKMKKYSGPAILVLYESQPYKHLTPNDLLDGMYGKIQIPFVIERVQGRRKFTFLDLINSGRDRMMTPNDNTSISAIVVFPYPEPKGVIVDVYHNRYATRPLDQETFTFPNLDVKHYFKHPHLAYWGDLPHEGQIVDLRSQLEALSGQAKALEERNAKLR